MLKNYQQYISRAFILSMLMLFALQFAATNTCAQYDTVEVEGIKQDPPPEEEYTGDENDEDEYFEYRSALDTFKVTQRKVPDSIKRAMQEDKAFWYANTAIEKKKEEEKKNNKTYTPLGQQAWVRTLVWIIIIGVFAAVVMWYLAENNVGLFRKKNKIIAAATEEEVEMEDIFAINYQKEIDKAAAQGNYRLAVRLMFLRLLKNMSEKNVIQYKTDKTNFDYLLELHPTQYYKDFFRITRNYEYTWYGQFEIDADAYTIIRNDFDQFERNLGRA